MKMLLTGIFGTAVLCAMYAAQDTTPNSAPPPQAQTPAQPSRNTRIAPGSVIPVQLTKSVDAKKVKTGDEVDAQVTEDLKSGNDEIVVPKNTKVIGRVTEAQARNKEQKESQIGIAFDHAVMKDGSDMPLPASIQAIISPSYLSGSNNNGSAQDATQPSSSPAAGGMPSNSNSRAAGMGAPQTANSSAAAGEEPASANAHQPITGNTQGVLGISNLKLSTPAEPTQASVVSSEKNNVKLESGTLLLLRVNQ
ncbi:MAG: hypothetical protein WB660_27305 [Candidatus Sulfotelmatobacter sp.]